ncbi:M20/M25/M40 family metallo-hydrolase [Ectobacillus antri]|uniref:M20/M25/M40 family metallo-hydrolase n=1 Tax=Ectobacillus antri TaxID=2486280 RepID=A0ABT6H9M6_9BACI|nr:M20/M25/M40 family metallo-hydrolase [Ectobacillus antri]MDG4658525.1 M20/M25/M40 family metallo-hydrolase [Ectobacillus antri]MDG5755508.1 M20/M25/M40 family metallo-hydrolase [Ectobacillus antri]
MKKTWQQLFIRQGFQLQEENGVFNCLQETETNKAFLLRSLDALHVEYKYDRLSLEISTPAVSEKMWLAVIDGPERKGYGDVWFEPGVDELELYGLDTYISGIVREFNRLGLQTTMSCDGHNGRRTTFVLFVREEDAQTATKILNAIGIKARSRASQVNIFSDRRELLDAAETLHTLDKESINDMKAVQRQLFHNSLENLLSISGASENEEAIREYVKEQLTPYVDHITVDPAGNLLAQKTYGHGPTILLNAHLDTYEEFEPGRVIQKQGNIWSSSKGILGADDRAGIAVLLAVAKRLHLRERKFRGTIKFIFTVKEEIGLCGAKQVDETFLWGVNAAIVVDRRGKGDIVTSCGNTQLFCTPEYGAFFEEVAAAEGLKGWKCTQGGSSDTRIWAEHGIPSVNLSVGYQNEHTDRESLDVEACYETFELVCGILAQSVDLYRIANGRGRIVNRVLR